MISFGIGQGVFWKSFFCSSLFGWKKQEETIHAKNPQQNSNQNLGASRPKSTLQGSVLDLERERAPNADCAENHRFSRTEKAPKENLHKEFRRDPGRGVKEGA